LVTDERVIILDASCVVSEASTFSNVSGGSICLRAPVVDVEPCFDGQFYQLWERERGRGLGRGLYGSQLTEGYDFRNDISPMEGDSASCKGFCCLLLGVSRWPQLYEVALVLRMLDCDFQEPRCRRVGLVTFRDRWLFTGGVSLRTLTLV
jgi:hypothetical protein